MSKLLKPAEILVCLLLQVLSLRPEKATVIYRLLSLFHRYKSLRDFRYVPLELDMPDGSICCLTATRFISYRVLSEAKNISILPSKNIEQTKFAYRQKWLNKLFGHLNSWLLLPFGLNPIITPAPKTASKLAQDKR